MSSVRKSLTFSLLLALAACGKGGDAPASGKPTELVPTKLDPLNLTMDLPANSKVGAHWDDSVEGVDIKTPKPLRAEISVKVHKTAEDMERTKVIVPDSVQNQKSEKLADGEILTFDYSSSVGLTHAVEFFRTIGGRHIECSCRSSGVEEIAAATAACKTLR